MQRRLTNPVLLLTAFSTARPSQRDQLRCQRYPDRDSSAPTSTLTISTSDGRKMAKRHLSAAMERPRSLALPIFVVRSTTVDSSWCNCFMIRAFFLQIRRLVSFSWNTLTSFQTNFVFNSKSERCGKKWWRKILLSHLRLTTIILRSRSRTMTWQVPSHC